MSLAGKTVLVTGATGFLGAALVYALVDVGANVRAQTRAANRADFLTVLRNLTVVEGDVTNPAQVRAMMSGVDVVFHVAVSYGSRERQRAVNADGTRNVAQAAAEAGVERMVHVSSIAVYGYELPSLVTEAQPYTTTQAEPYSRSKIEAEMALISTTRQTGLKYSIIRPGMIYGPRSSMWTTQMFALARRNPTPFVGLGSGLQPIVHVDDVVALTLLLAEHPAAVGEAFQCVSDPTPSWNDFIGAYQRMAGHDRWLRLPSRWVEPIVNFAAALAPRDSSLRDVPALLRWTDHPIRFSMDKARTRLGWEPQMTLEQGMIDTEAWLRAEGLLV